MKFVKSRTTLKRRNKQRKMNASKRGGNGSDYGNALTEVDNVRTDVLETAAKHLSQDDPIRKKIENIIKLIEQVRKELEEKVDEQQVYTIEDLKWDN